MAKKSNGEQSVKPVNTPATETPPTPPPAVAASPEPAVAAPAPVVSTNPEPTKAITMSDTPETTDAAPEESQALAPMTQDDEKKANKAALMEIAKKLPARYKMDVIQTVRPTSEELMGLVEKLPDAMQMQFMELVAKTNPKKQGMHSTRSGFNPVGIKMYHGTGNDPLRPPKMAKGEFYTEDSRILGESFVGAVIAVIEGRTKWPSKDLGEEGKAPICFSADRIMGNVYGDCLSCPYAKTQYNQGGCGQDVTIYIVDKELTGVYSIQFAKTSGANGGALVKILQKSKNLWDRWFKFNIESRENKKEDYLWYATKATVVQDPKDAKATDTDVALHPMFNALSRVIDVDVFYPKLAAVYSAPKKAPPQLAADNGPTIDPNQIGGDISGDNGDFGKPNV